MLVEDFKPEMFYKPEPENIETGFLSCYPILACYEEKAEILIGDQLEHYFHEAMLNYPVDDHTFP
jgi:hypothetical protein